MTVVAPEGLSRDLQAHASELIEKVGLVPQAQDRPLNAQDLLFYLTRSSMPMARYMREHGLYLDGDGLHFTVSSFPDIRRVAGQVVAQWKAGDRSGVWREFDLSGAEDADNDGIYVLIALNALELVYAPRPSGLER